MSSNTLQAASHPAPAATVLDRLRGLPWLVPAALLLVVFSLEMFFSVRTESQTFDEPAHLYSGYSYWLHSDFGVNPEHPPLAKLVAALPLLVSRPKYPDPPITYFRAVEFVGGIQLLNPPGSDALLNNGRAAISIFALLLAVLVALAANEMFGRETALVALLIFVFDPLIIGNAPLITTDTAVSCFIFATVYAFYRYTKKPSILRLLMCGLAAGLALAAKHSALFVFVVLLLLAIVQLALNMRPKTAEAETPQVPRTTPQNALRLAASLLAIVIISVTILWAFYSFRYQARPGSGIMIPPTAEFLKQMNHPAEAKIIGFAEQHHLLPEAYLYGLTDVVTLCRDGRVMFLFGKIYPGGRWFYFPATLLIKCTLGFLALLLLLPFARSLWAHQYRREILFLTVPPVAYFAWAMTSKLDMGIRHILPIFPFLIVLAAAGAVSLARRSRVWKWAIGLLLVAHAASSLAAAPNYLPYSNEAFGGPQNTYRSLDDPNVGWGGGLKALSAYLKEHHITNCWIAYSAFPDPASFGIPCKQLPTFFGLVAELSGVPFQQSAPESISGPVFISSEEVDGSEWGANGMSPYVQFVSLHPAHIIADEILEYDGTFSIPRVASVGHGEAALSVLQNKGNPADALANAREAVRLDPDSLAAHDILIYALAANGLKDDAMREYKVAKHIFDTVHPEFQIDEFPPDDPSAPPPH